MSNYSEYSVDDVADWVTKLGFEAEAQYFRDAEIDGSVLPLITEDHLKEIGVNLIGPRLLILKNIRKLCGMPPQGTPPPIPQRMASDDPPSQRQQRSSQPGPAKKPSARPSTASTSTNGDDIPKWKKDHEKMVENIRAARKLAAWEKAKEEGRDVGPPPEMPAFEEPPGLVQCPVCGRKMGEEAAKHHIPTCKGPAKGRR